MNANENQWDNFINNSIKNKKKNGELILNKMNLINFLG